MTEPIDAPPSAGVSKYPLLATPHIHLHGPVDHAMYESFRQQIANAPQQGSLVVAISTLGGDPEVARLMGDELRLLRAFKDREILFLGTRAGVYGIAPLLVAFCFGLEPRPAMLLVPFIGVLTGIGFAALGMLFSAMATTFDDLSYVISGVITPLFLVAGTFFPIDGLPEWAQVAAQFNPLYHLVELVRSAVFGFEIGSDAVHLAVLVVYGLLTWRLAIAWLERRVIV